MTETRHVVIVDDDDAVREALTLLMHGAGLTVQQFSSGSDFLAAPRPTGPACLLLDIHMPGVSGLDVQAQLQAERCLLPIVFLTGHGQVPLAVNALKQGAMDFLEKPLFDREALLDIICNATEQHRQQLALANQDAQWQQRIALLSPRELEVARLAADGQANKVIALELGISERTVEVHRGRAMKKLALRTAADLVKKQVALKHQQEH
ncbi:MAG: DNA-binding response regulator [Halomonadaceae bacterium]|nr:MAG: DNA-binding response regulator [Halomonadaceae bacterium]